MEGQSQSLPETVLNLRPDEEAGVNPPGSFALSSLLQSRGLFTFFRKRTSKGRRTRSIPCIRINSGEGPLPSDSSSSKDPEEELEILPEDEVFIPNSMFRFDENEEVKFQRGRPLLQKQDSVHAELPSIPDSGSSSRSSSSSHTEHETTASTNDKALDASRHRKLSNTEIKQLNKLLFPQCSEITDGPIHNARASRPRNHSHPNFTPRTTRLLQPNKIDPRALHAQSHTTMTRFSLPGYFRRFSQQGLVSSASDSMVSLTNRALVSFIAEENFAGFQHLLESRRVLVDDRDENGGTALMVAAGRGKLNFVRSLIEHGSDVNSEDEDNWTALLFAAKEGHDEIVSELLDHGGHADHKDMAGWTSLMWASYKGRTRVARILMEKGNVDVNAYGNYIITCIAWSAGRGYAEITRDLIQHGAKVNTGDKYGTTPLIWAARKGYLEIVDMLLHAEAMVDACGMTSWTALLVATAGNHIEVVKLLLDHKSNVNAIDKDGCSALSIACKEGFHDIAVTLLNFGAYINVSDRGGTSNLVHASKGGHRSIVEALLKRHADVNVHSKDRKTALYWAIEKSHVGVVKLILGSNPDLEITTKEGDTALIKAVRNRNLEIVALLLEKRAKVSATDKNGDTSLHLAMRARSKQIVELLLRNPVHSQLLYRPNRCGETPYNIDRSSPKPILPQIFGHRGLNTQEDGENLLGYSLYSSALADMLSDPSLNMPITVGLFARWGSGKGFLLNKLQEEMMSFARQWFNPVLSFSYLIFVLTFCLSCLIGVIGALCVDHYRWIVGGSITAGIMILVNSFLFVVWFSTKRAKYEWSLSHRISRYIATKFDYIKLIFQVIFCHPPGCQFSDRIDAQPINFYFTEQGKISSTTGGENSVVQMLGSLYTCLENDYGTFPTRLYRAFKPSSIGSTKDWRWRKLCCIPYCLIFLLCFMATLVGSVIAIFAFSSLGDNYATEHFNNVAVKVVMYCCILFVGLLLVANLYTIGQIAKTVVFSHRRHLQRAVSRMYALKAEGFLNSLKSEVNLITDMVKCLDGFTGRQSRMVVIVDGLDSGEQEKVLQVLDAVHILFSDAKSPFIILLAIDPHIIAKGIELNVHAVMNESNIGGHEYLRNLVHLPFFLQNAALRKVKHVKMLESTMRQKKPEEDPGPQIVLSTRRASIESAFGVAMPLERFEKPSTKKPRRLGLKTSESIASSLGSNLNKATGPTDLKKILLGDDYFSDINPKSMRRLMNIIHITGRLLKAFNIDFNWYHLTTWVNVTEQWPYRLSWMILYAEQFQKDLDDGLSLKNVYERVRPFVPTSKEVDPNLGLDRDDKKLDVYLGLHKGSLLVSTMYVFLPFTISLDPQLRKDIQELYQPLDQFLKQGPMMLAGPTIPPSSPFIQPHPGLRYRANQQGSRGNSVQCNGPVLSTPNFYPGQMYPGMQMWPLGIPSATEYAMKENYDPALMRDLRNKKLSIITVDGISDLLKSLASPVYANLSKYEDMIKQNNICGRVLTSCDLMELKQVLKMSFGDWELFKNVVLALRELEQPLSGAPELGHAGSFRLNVTTPDRERGDKKQKPNVLEKQVTMENQLICGALELLNDEARDDALKGDVSPASTLSPINSEPEGTDIPRDDHRNSRSRSPKPSRHLDENETEVLYVMGSTCMTLTAEIPDSPLLGISKSPKRHDTFFYVANETSGRSPASSRRSLSREVDFDTTKTKGGILSNSPRKMRSRSSLKERKGIIMNPKSPGMAFDSRKSNASYHTSSDEESKALMGTSAGRKVSTSRTPYHPASPKKRSKEENSNRLSKIRSIFTREAEGQGRSHPMEYDHRAIRNGPMFLPTPSASSSEPAFRQYRAPTPLPPFGSDEYYRIIKSDNPSPTSSNRSELGSTPDHLSSGENLFLPGPPDLPAESPYPRRFVPFRPIPTFEPMAANPFSRLPTVGFLPPRNQHGAKVDGAGNPKESLQRNAPGVGESMQGRMACRSATPGPSHQLVKSRIMKSDPVLNIRSTRSSQGEIQSQEQEDHNISDLESQNNTEDRKGVVSTGCDAEAGTFDKDPGEV